MAKTKRKLSPRITEHEAQYLPGTRIPTAAEERRLDDLTVYTSTILSHRHGADLDQALGGLIKRQGRTDTVFRRAALESIHPDDVVKNLAKQGMTLQRFGIESIKLKR